MAKELYMDTISIRYVTLPELSVEGFQANVTLVGVMAVVCRLVGVVGALRSLAARAGAGLRSNSSTTRIAAATRAVRQKGTFLIMLCLQSPHKNIYNRRAAVYTYIYGLDASSDLSSFVSFSFRDYIQARYYSYSLVELQANSTARVWACQNLKTARQLSSFWIQYLDILQD